MKRRSFLKLFGISTAASVPIIASATPNKDIVKFSELFIVRKRNTSLLKFRDGMYYSEFKKRIKDSGIPVYDCSPVYNSVYSIAFPYKKEYKSIEVRHFMESLFDACLKRKRLFYNDHDGVVRFYHDKKAGVIVPDLFDTNSWNEPRENDQKSTRFFKGI